MQVLHFLPILTLMGPIPGAAAAVKSPPAKVISTQRVDLRGTGKKDLIQLSVLRVILNGGMLVETRLTVNGKVSVVVPSHGSPESLGTVDVNHSDRVREIDVRAIGPSDGEEHYLYRFDGAKIHEMGTLETPRYLGNGIVLDSRRQGFWESSHKFVLGKDHRLKEVPQEFYAVRYGNKLKKPLALRVKRNRPEILANLRVGSQVEVILSDLKGWYLVTSENGLTGWMRESEVEQAFGIMMLP